MTHFLIDNLAAEVVGAGPIADVEAITEAEIDEAYGAMKDAEDEAAHRQRTEPRDAQPDEIPGCQGDQVFP